eukprot:TRINITY_DN2173_c0_g1_i2.p1 TRINITY_DN2173_c0_g1~~TRINITY_DN2173_c0_g1_i2.p1  ORF type:complete len:123 (+),score=6.06 TRINITY_DN2173_c0_g1_i2:287-655(+)
MLSLYEDQYIAVSDVESFEKDTLHRFRCIIRSFTYSHLSYGNFLYCEKNAVLQFFKQVFKYIEDVCHLVDYHVDIFNTQEGFRIRLIWGETSKSHKSAQPEPCMSCPPSVELGCVNFSHSIC